MYTCTHACICVYVCMYLCSYLFTIYVISRVYGVETFSQAIMNSKVRDRKW